MFTESKVTEIFFMADEFCKVFNRMMEKYAIEDQSRPSKRKYHRDSMMSDAEVMVIMILFHNSGYRCLKHFYNDYVRVHLRPSASVLASVSWTPHLCVSAVIRESISIRLSRDSLTVASVPWDGSSVSNCTLFVMREASF